MATKLAASEFTRSMGVFTTFWTKLEKAVYEFGGTAEDLLRLSKEESDEAIRNFAKAIAKPAFQAQILAGDYDKVRGLEYLGSQVCHQVTTKTRVVMLGEPATIREIWEKFGDRMADVSELLDFGAKHPEACPWRSVMIIWKEADSFRLGSLSYYSRRDLWFMEPSSDAELSGLNWFLLRE